MSLQFSSVRFAYPDASFRLGVEALSIASGERLALVGPSGSGKSTLLALAAGLLIPDQGKVEALDVEISRLSETDRRRERLRMGLVFQDLDLLGHLGMLDNVLLPLHLTTRGSLEAERIRAESLLVRLGLDAGATRPVIQLSRGERQRVAVARALVHQPALILADEPTASLDSEAAERVWSVLLEVSRELSSTLVATTHEDGPLSRFDRVIDMKQLEGAKP